jgi:glycosyltransferase involved in cell wall biosynthesis
MSLLHEPAAPTGTIRAIPTVPTRRSPDLPSADAVHPLPLTTSGRKHRVLVVSPQPFYEDRGTPIAVRQVVQALADLGCEVDLLCYPIGSSPAIEGVRYLRCANPLRFRSVPVGLSLRKLVLDASIVARLIRAVCSRRYDVIHAIEEGGFPAALAARALGIPLIYDMQSSLPEQLSERWFFGLRPVHRLLRACERWLLRRSDQVICSAGLAEKIGGIEPRVTLREWSFYAEPRHPLEVAERSAIRAELGVPEHRRAVLYTGNFASYQGVDLLLRAAYRLCERRDDIDFVLVGGGEDEMRDVRRELERKGLASRVHLHARCTRAEVTRLLQAADVLVSPRCFGGNLPLKIFDYLGAARPIVATDIPTHRSVLDDSTAVLSPPTAGGLADAIETILDDPGRGEALATAGAALAEQRFGRGAFVEVVAGLYRDALRLESGAVSEAIAAFVPATPDSRAAASALASGTTGY